MSLNYNLTKVKNNPANAVTEVLIWTTMSVGFDAITAKNAVEFYARVHLLELLNGTMLRQGKNDRYITLDDIKQHIGLSTNAGSFSRSEFMRRQSKNYFREYDNQK